MLWFSRGWKRFYLNPALALSCFVLTDSEAAFAVDRNAPTVNHHGGEAVRDKAAALDVIFFPLLLGEWE